MALGDCATIIAEITAPIGGIVFIIVLIAVVALIGNETD